MATLLNFVLRNLTAIENLPDSLLEFHCSHNQITAIENLPDSLKVFNFFH